jgi:long-chain acyl-CoA synthetase
MRTNAVAVPLNVNYQEEELKYYLRSSAARVVVTDTARHAKLDAVLQKMESSPPIVLLEEAGAMNGTTVPAAESASDSPALQQYSTGSTGQPKPVIRTQRQLLAEVDHYAATVRITPADRILAVVPMFHAHGFGNCLLAALMNGATLVVLETFNPREVLSVLASERITIYPGVPFMFKMLTETLLKTEPDLSALRLAFSAGGALDPEVSRKFHARFGQHIRQLYGTTETGSITINLDEDIAGTLESVGPAMPAIEMTVVDEAGHAVPPGEVGEIGIRSPAMTCGYDGLEEVTKNSFRNGFFFPGDVGRIDALGRVFVTGRKTFFINVGGNKVDPAEVERIIAGSPKVSDVVVLGVKTPYGGETVKAVVVAREKCEAAEILETCRGKLAEYKVPKVVEFRSEIPRSPLGKVLRKYLIDTMN